MTIRTLNIEIHYDEDNEDYILSQLDSLAGLTRFYSDDGAYLRTRVNGKWAERTEAYDNKRKGGCW